MTGTSTIGPITAANASPEFKPKIPTVTATASSKLLLEAVNAWVTGDRKIVCVRMNISLILFP